MLFYDNGKSACRAGLGAKPRSQHLWCLPAGRRSCTALADARRLDIEGYRVCADPCILHFPICGLGWFKAKYRTLGDFPDAWLGGKVRLPESFHSDAREACAYGNEALEALFHREVLLDDSKEVARQIACGTCLRRKSHAILQDAVPAPEPGPKAKEEDAAPAPQRPSPVASAAPLDTGPQGIERGWILSKTLGYL